MIAQDQTFTGCRIHLDGSHYINCRFVGCTIVINGLMDFVMQDAEFENCNWEMQGPAHTTLQLMQALYRSGCAPLIEAMFDRIRGTDQIPSTLN